MSYIVCYLTYMEDEKNHFMANLEATSELSNADIIDAMNEAAKCKSVCSPSSSYSPLLCIVLL